MPASSSRATARRVALVLGALCLSAVACSSTTTTTSTGSGGSTAPGSTPASGALTVNFSSKGCDPAKVEAKAGELTLTVVNKGDETGEFEILQGKTIKGEAENIAPNFNATIKATLEPGTYDLLCGEDSFPKGSLTVR